MACKDGKVLCRGVADQEEKDVDVDEANVEGPVLCMEIPPSSKPPKSKSSELQSAVFPKGLKNKRRKSASRDNPLLPFSGTDTIGVGDLDAEHLVLYNESCEAFAKRYPSYPSKVREFRKQNIKRIILLRKEIDVKVKDVILLVNEVEVIRKEMLRRGEPELAEYVYIILAQTIKDEQHVAVLTKCPTVPRGDRVSQSVEMLTYGDDIVLNATYKCLKNLDVKYLITVITMVDQRVFSTTSI